VASRAQPCAKPRVEKVERSSLFLVFENAHLKTPDNICLEEEDVFQCNDKRGGAALGGPERETPPSLEMGGKK